MHGDCPFGDSGKQFMKYVYALRSDIARMFPEMIISNNGVLLIEGAGYPGYTREGIVRFLLE